MVNIESMEPIESGNHKFYLQQSKLDVYEAGILDAVCPMSDVQQGVKQLIKNSARNIAKRYSELEAFIHACGGNEHLRLRLFLQNCLTVA